MASPTIDRRMGLVGNVGWKAPVAALAASNITLSGQQTIDGVAVVARNAAGVADRVLVIGQSNAAQNGIWNVSTGDWTRSADANGNYDLGTGSTVLVSGGTTYGGTFWRLTTANPITIGTTAQTWASSFVAPYVPSQQETQVATQGQTLFTLTQLAYSRGINSLAVYVNGLLMRQTVDYAETSTTSVTFTTGLSAGDEVTFIAGPAVNGTVANDASLVSYTPAGTGAVATNVQAKLRESASLLDFGADPSGLSDSTAAIQAAITASYGKTLVVPPGTYLVASEISINSGLKIIGTPGASIFKLSQYMDQAFRTGFSSAPTRTVRNLLIEGIVFDGNSLAPQRWLQTSGGATIANPEADYVAGTGALASGITGVSLTAVLSGNAVASVTINTGGSGWNGHPTKPYVPTTVPLKFAGGGGFGAAGYATISGGTLTSTTITTGGSGYTSPPTVTTMGGYADISLLVDPAVNRRNPNYTTATTLLDLRGTQDTVVRNCIFRNNYGRGIIESGGFNVTIDNNVFDTIGKSDSAFWAIFTQSYGTPGGGAPFYSPSENIRISNNRAYNLERSFIGFSPTKGGIVENNYVDGWKEACIFCNDNINSEGGYSIIRNNTLKNGVNSDISCCGIDGGGSTNLLIEGNWIENAQEQGMVLTGMSSVSVLNNTIKECAVDFTVPYGPFSERFAFSVGTRPTAGQQTPLTSGAFANIGSIGAVGCSNLRIAGNHFIETRASYPPVFRQVKSGSNNIAGKCVIENNFLSVPSGMPLLDTSTPNVWEVNIPLTIRDNEGHASEAPVVIDVQIASAATGQSTITPGFRPRAVHVFAAANNATVGRASIGQFTWNSAATGNDFSLIIAVTSGTGQRLSISPGSMAKTTDTVPANKFVAEFVRWTETGFVINTITAAETTNLRFVCYP